MKKPREKRVLIRLSEGRTCSVWVGRDLFARNLVWEKDPVLRAPAHAILIADSRLLSHTRAVNSTLRKKGWTTTVIRLKAAESSKSIRTVETLYKRLIQAGADRSSVIFALGGGVIGDVSGFLAATYMRGIRWVGIPTTLLAQVDSSIGGKTGVNLTFGKNLIGAFHQPSSVICDVSFLKTLPEREVVSGLGEIVKYGLLSGPDFFHWLSLNWDSLLRLNEAVMEKAITRCVSIKARVIEKDEREILGLRASLNLGHTIGHALESATGFSRFRHGEAVIHGLRAMLELSVIRNHLPSARKREIESLLARARIPGIPASLTAAQVSKLTFHDKKTLKRTRRYVLLKDIGKPLLDARVSERQLMQALRAIGIRSET